MVLASQVGPSCSAWSQLLCLVPCWSQLLSWVPGWSQLLSMVPGWSQLLSLVPAAMLGPSCLAWSKVGKEANRRDLIDGGFFVFLFLSNCYLCNQVTSDCFQKEQCNTRNHANRIGFNVENVPKLFFINLTNAKSDNSKVVRIRFSKILLSQNLVLV